MTSDPSTVALSAIRQLVRKGASGQDTADALGSLVAATASLPLASMQAWEKAIREEIDQIAETPKSSFWFFRKPKARRFASVLDLASRNGFDRERILRASTAGLPNAFFLVLALRRLNDWVPQVRAAARQALPGIAGASNPDHVVDALWAVLPRLPSWARGEPACVEIMVSLLSDVRVRPLVKARIISASAGPAAFILAQAGRSPIPDPWLSEVAESAVQPAVRAFAYRCQLEGRMTWLESRKWVWTDKAYCKGELQPIIGKRPLTVDGELEPVLKSALGDRSAAVRFMAGGILLGQLDALGETATALATRLASDACPAVAARGRFALARLGGEA